MAKNNYQLSQDPTQLLKNYISYKLDTGADYGSNNGIKFFQDIGLISPSMSFKGSSGRAQASNLINSIYSDPNKLNQALAKIGLNNPAGISDFQNQYSSFYNKSNTPEARANANTQIMAQNAATAQANIANGDPLAAYRDPNNPNALKSTASPVMNASLLPKIATATTPSVVSATPINSSLYAKASGYTGASITDFLSKAGQPSDFASRAKLAAEQGITGYTGTANQNTQLLNKLRQGISTPTVTQPATITTDGLKTTAQGINLPPPTAPDTYVSTITSATNEVANTRKTLEDTYARQLEDFKKQAEISQKRIDELNATTEGIITKDVKKLTAPFEAKLEESERQRLKIEENYFENQSLVGELEGLLTEGNTLIQQMQGVTGLTGIRNPRINQAIEGVNARAGVIQAVMAARNGQIAQAYNLIDRSVNAITADRRDQLNYYNTLLGYYGGLKDEEGKKLVTLNNDQKDVINSQINLLQSDLVQAQKNAQSIKDAMTDPSTALAYAKAGITLNDSPEVIGAKLAKYAAAEEVRDLTNKMSQSGYQAITPQQAAGLSADQLIRYKDSNGKELIFKAPLGEGDIRSVDGGLYDVVNKQWVVRPGGGESSGGGGTSIGGDGVGAPVYTPGIDPTVDAWVKGIQAGKANFSDIKDEDLRNKVAIGLANTADPKTATIVATFQDKLNKINVVINSPGLSSAVGPNPAARISSTELFTAKRANFITSVEQIASQETLDTLINLKRQGGTLGAVNEQEFATLKGAATRINGWAIPDETGKTIGYKTTEEEFMKELNLIKSITERWVQEANKNMIQNLPQEDISEIDLIYGDQDINPANYY